MGSFPPKVPVVAQVAALLLAGGLIVFRLITSGCGSPAHMPATKAGSPYRAGDGERATPQAQAPEQERAQAQAPQEAPAPASATPTSTSFPDPWGNPAYAAPTKAGPPFVPSRRPVAPPPPPQQPAPARRNTTSP